MVLHCGTPIPVVFRLGVTELSAAPVGSFLEKLILNVQQIGKSALLGACLVDDTTSDKA